MAHQATLALAAGFEKHQKVTCRAEFLGAMNVVVPWRELCAEIEPFYPKPGNGRPPVSILLGCGLRRAELSALRREEVQIRQGHWVIVDLVGKGNQVRTVPMPLWVKEAVDRWLSAASVASGYVFRAVSRHGTAWEPAFLRRWSVMSSGAVPDAWSSTTLRLKSSAHLRKALSCE